MSGTVSGTAVKEPVNGGTMTAYALSNGAMGAKIASTTTNADGIFSLAMSGGMMGGSMMGSRAGTSDLATDMTNFMRSAMNHSGLTSANMNALIQKLASSNGTL